MSTHTDLKRIGTDKNGVVMFHVEGDTYKKIRDVYDHPELCMPFNGKIESVQYDIFRGDVTVEQLSESGIRSYSMFPQLWLKKDIEDILGIVEVKTKMTGNEYQKLAMRTCSIPYDQVIQKLQHAVFGLTSEAGEVSGIMQKVYQGHPIDRDHLKKECGDVLWMVAEICDAMEFTMDDVMQTNIDKLKARYPDGFDPERSLHRKPGDV